MVPNDFVMSGTEKLNRKQRSIDLFIHLISCFCPSGWFFISVQLSASNYSSFQMDLWLILQPMFVFLLQPQHWLAEHGLDVKRRKTMQRLDQFGQLQ